jgi:hypothetical protein
MKEKTRCVWSFACLCTLMYDALVTKRYPLAPIVFSSHQQHISDTTGALMEASARARHHWIISGEQVSSTDVLSLSVCV